MADIFRLHGDPHEEVQKLLPWYVKRTLHQEERDYVAAHLAGCPACRAEHDLEVKLSDSLAAVPLDAESGWAAMAQRMAEQPARAPAPRNAALLSRRVPLGWAFAGSLGAAACAVLAVSLTPLSGPQGVTYNALGSPAVEGEQGNAVVLFKPDTSVSEIQAILLANEARIVDGPNESGALVLQVEQARRDKALRLMRKTSQIVLAEPIGPGSGP